MIAMLFFAFPQSAKTTIYLTGGVDPVGEVWITNIEINGQRDTLRDYFLSGKWKHIKGNIVYVPSNSQADNTLKLSYKNAESVKLTFMKHNWSGGVGISDGDEYTELNLLDQSGSVVYDVKHVNSVALEPINVAASALFLLIVLGLLIYTEKRVCVKTIQCNWGLAIANAFILCTISEAFGKFGYMIFVFVMMYFLFVRNKKQEHTIYYITLVMSFIYSLYQFANPYLPSTKIVIGLLLLLEVFYSFEIGKGKKWSRYAVIAVAPILCFFMIECISNVDILQLKIPMIFLGILIIVGFLLVVANVLSFKNIGWYLAFLSTFVISTGNYYVIQFKKYALTFGDLMQLQTGMAVAGDYQYYLSDGIVYGFLILVVLVSLVHCYIPVEQMSAVKRGKRMLLGLAMAFLQLGIIHSIDFQQTFHVAWDNWDTTKTYSKYSFPVSFITSVQRMMIDKPEGYSKEAAETILNGYVPAMPEKHAEKPVIIAIMNESLSDLNDLGSLGETEDVMWYMNSMDEYLEKGKTFMSV